MWSIETKINDIYYLDDYAFALGRMIINWLELGFGYNDYELTWVRIWV